MRNFLAVILATLAGLTAAFGLVSWKLSSLIHEPEPVQEILATGQAAEDFKRAVPGALGNMAIGATGIAVVDEIINQAVTETGNQVVDHEDFDQAWSESLELTRTGWIDDISALRQEMDAGTQIEDNSTDAQLDLRLDPIATLSMTVIENRVQDALSGLPGLEDLEIDFATDLDATVPMSIPPISMLTAQQVVFTEELMTLWPATLAMSALLFLMAIIIAARGSRWIVWLLTGLLAALAGVAVKLGYSWMQRHVLDRVQESASLELLRPLLRAVQDWADPQLIVLIVAGVGVALIGILGGFISANRRRRT